MLSISDIDDYKKITHSLWVSGNSPSPCFSAAKRGLKRIAYCRPLSCAQFYSSTDWSYTHDFRLVFLFYFYIFYLQFFSFCCLKRKTTQVKTEKSNGQQPSLSPPLIKFQKPQNFFVNFGNFIPVPVELIHIYT